MTRARILRRLAPILLALAACTASRATIAPPETPAGVPCEPLADGVVVAITAEVDSATAAAYLDTAPLGSCVRLSSRRVDEREARDALDGNLSLLITSLPAVLAYAASRADLESAPLLWDRVYAVVASDSVAARLLSPGELDSLRAELARDVVRGDARAATVAACGDALASSGKARRVVYPGGDQVARSIAARLVALAAPGDSLRVAPEDGARTGANVAAVVTLRSGDSLPCDRGYVVPLVETRARAIRRVERP